MLDNKTNRSVLIISWLVFIIFTFVSFNLGFYSIYEKKTSGSATEAFYESIAKFTKTELNEYYYFLIQDYFFLILLGLVLFVTINFLLDKLRLNNLFRLLLIFPVLFVLFDVLENSLEIYLLSNLPGKLDSIANFTELVTLFKFITVGISFVTLILCLLGFLIKTVSRKIAA